ncbi:hypothetical protein EJB05_02416, partial [Eragrostis curvula]
MRLLLRLDAVRGAMEYRRRARMWLLLRLDAVRGAMEYRSSGSIGSGSVGCGGGGRNGDHRTACGDSAWFKRCQTAPGYVSFEDAIGGEGRRQRRPTGGSDSRGKFANRGPSLHIVSELAAEDRFAAAAYPVTWPSAADTQVAPEAPTFKAQEPAAEDRLAAAAYPVTWPSAADSPVAADTPTFKAHEHAEMPAHGGGGLHVQRGMLFLRKSLYPGALLPRGTRLAGTAPMAMQFASRSQAGGIPFSLNRLDQILTMFKTPTRARRRSRRRWNSPPKFWAPSTLAASSPWSTAPKTTSEPAQYTVVRISRIGGADLQVVCHAMPYPYMVRYCHRPAEVEALILQLCGVDVGGGGATAVAICHKNTTTWDQRYFNMLNADRGEEICHFMPQNYVLWLKM